MLLEISLLFLTLLFIWSIVTFRRWKRSLLLELRRNSEIANTSCGEIEYALRGEGPVLVMLHGGPGGYDQGLLDADMWIREGFSLLSVSRPGYLRTPLSSGETLEEQADAIEALLDELGITKVAVLGASAGGPVALHFTLRHPERVSALVLVAAVSKKYEVRESQRKSVLGRIFLSETTADLGVWFYDILTRRWTSLSLKEMFKENVDLEPEALNGYVKEVMSIPEQVTWYKRFIRTTCPMSPRMAGLDNDLVQLEKVSFSNLGDIRCPTLVVQGTADTDVPFTNAEFSSSSIPNARLYKIEKAGHVVWLGEHVPQMNSEMVQFLREAK
ncbi:alpha/beta hydrolase [Candidatus Thorarchaeota archaeon]|nr:MAG: alpha/beta hydrolase [Candidatus Thorarchaeota archaeon]